MSKISFSCPQCNKPFATDATAVGKTARCPACSQQFTVPNPNQSPADPIIVADPVPQLRTKQCRFCGEQIAVAATKCKHCGEWLQRPRGMPTAHAGIKIVAPANAVIFTIITLGIYQLFWLYRIIKELHQRGSTETTPGKAVGFLFIPFYNFVWVFIVWKRLGDAIAREYSNAGFPVPATGLVWLAPIGALFGVAANFAPPLAVVQLILLPIAIGNAQAWMNQLAGAPMPTLPTAPSTGHTAGQSKSCPTCGEHIPLDALKCRFCDHQFSHEDVNVLKQQMQQRATLAAEDMRRRSLSSRKTLLQVFGWILTGIGTLFLFLCIIGFLVGPSDPAKSSEHLIGFTGAIALFCLPPIAIGVVLLLFARKAKTELNDLTKLPIHNGA